MGCLFHLGHQTAGTLNSGYKSIWMMPLSSLSFFFSFSRGVEVVSVAIFLSSFCSFFLSFLYSFLLLGHQVAGTGETGCNMIGRCSFSCHFAFVFFLLFFFFFGGGRGGRGVLSFFPSFFFKLLSLFLFSLFFFFFFFFFFLILTCPVRCFSHSL